MPKLDGLGTVLDFLKGLQPKIAAQISTSDRIIQKAEKRGVHSFLRKDREYSY